MSPSEDHARLTPDEAVALLGDIAPTQRVGQQQMLRGAVTALQSRWHVELVAPTGTGKSFAALLAAVASGGVVVLSTGTKALQRQYADNDIPTVRSALARHGIDVDVVMLKGRRNYGCKLQADEVVTNGPPDDVSRETAVAIRRTAKWIMRGDMDGDLAYAPPPTDGVDVGSVFEALTVDSDDCLRKRCTFYDECHFEAVKTKAAAADIVLTNHAVLCMHAACGGLILPPFDTIVLDEGHKFEDFAVSAFTSELTMGTGKQGNERGSLARLARQLMKVADYNPDQEHAAATSNEALMGLATELRLLFTEALEGRDADVECTGIGDHPTVAALLERVSAQLAGVSIFLGVCEPGDSATGKEWIAWNRAVSARDGIEGHLRMLQVDTAGVVTYLSPGKGDSVTLKVADTDVGKYLAPLLWNDSEGVRRGVVVTSATIPEGCGERLGLIAPQRAAVRSPFDLPNRTVYYCADDLPSAAWSNRREWEPLAMQRAWQVADAALDTGGVLVLCSSFAQVQTFATALKPLAMQRAGVTFIEDSKLASKDEIMARLQDATRPFAVLSRGFYEGLDLPRRLRAVIVPTFPFAVPSDPIQQARQSLEPHDSWPHPLDAATVACAIEQMAGRLIRCADDWGVVAFLDRRMMWGPAAEYLQRAVPPGVALVGAKRTDQVIGFLRPAAAVAS